MGAVADDSMMLVLGVADIKDRFVCVYLTTKKADDKRPPLVLVISRYNARHCNHVTVLGAIPRIPLSSPCKGSRSVR